MDSKIDTKDIRKLLKLFRQLSKLITSEPPEKNKELWEQCLKQSQKEFIDELKEHEKLLSPARTPPKKDIKEEEEEFQKAFQHNTTKMSEKKYHQMNSKYDKACSQIEEEIVTIMKDIDHFLYSIKESLLKFDRANGTLLAADWKEIRDILTIDNITHPNFQFYVQKAIDALEAIRAKIKRQQKIEKGEKPAETEQEATPLPINIKNSNVILGDVHQGGNLQVGNHTQIQEISTREEKNKGILKKSLKIVGVIIVSIIAAVVTDILGDFGWIESIKGFIYKIVLGR